MRGSKKNSERPEQVRKDKKGPAKLEPLRPQVQPPDVLRDEMAKFLSECPYPVLRIHRNGTVLFANKASEGLLKAKGSKVGGAAPAQWCRLVEEALSSGQVIREETKHDGRVFAFWAVPIADSNYVNFYGRDITERKCAEEQLRETTQTLEAVIQASPLPIFAVDRELIVKTWNPAAERTFGWSAQEVIGRRYPAIPKEKMGEADALFSRALESGLVEVETLRQRKDGSLIDVSISAAPLRDSRGNITGVMAVINDITERKRAEEALHFTRFALDNAVETMVCLSQDARYIDANDTFCRSVGYSREELLSMTAHDIDPNYSAKIWPKFWKKLKQSGSLTFESCHRTKDGKVFPVEVTVTFFKYKGKEYHCGFARDITERKRAEEAMRLSEEKFAKAFNSSPAAILITTLKESRFIDLNEIAMRVFGYTREEVVGHTAKELNMWANYNDRDIMVQSIRRGNAVRDMEARFRRKSSEVFDGIISVDIINIGGIECLISTIVDITERKKREEEMVRLNRVMETITDVNQCVFRIQDRDEMLRKVCETIVSYAYRMVWIGFCDEKTKQILPQAQAGFEEGYLESVKITYDDSEYGMGPSGMAVKTARHDIMRFIATDPRYEPWRAEAMKRGYRSSAAIPIFSKDKVIGVLTVYADKEDAFGQEEVKLLEELANDISTGLRGIDEQTRRRQAEQNLLEHQKRLKRLAAQLTLAEERERRRIAGELHDQVTQSLALAKIKLDTLHASAASHQPLAQALEDISGSLEKAIQDTRSLTFDLSNPILYELGFEAAVAEWLNEQVRDKHGIATEFKDDGQPKPLDDDVRVLLFRNVRELLINCIKYANADKVKVHIRRIDDSIEVTVEDNGIGFDPMEARAMAVKRAEFGLFSIRESLEELGGRFEIESKPGAGCKATMIVPLKRKGIDDERNKATHQGNGN